MHRSLQRAALAILLLAAAAPRAAARRKDRLPGEAGGRLVVALRQLHAEERRQHADADANAAAAPCDLGGDPSKCPLEEMAVNEQSILRAGGETECIFGSPYSFEVMRGADPSKLFVYFQGGGACWNEWSSVFLTSVANKVTGNTLLPCVQEFKPAAPGGIFNRTNGDADGDGRRDGLFLDYTIVTVNYCSGDLHVGDSVRPYEKDGRNVTQRGKVNTEAVLAWIKAQQGAGSLAPRLSTLVVAGSSAGAIGAQLWAPHLAGAFAHDEFISIFDSYIGVFPNAHEGTLVRDLGACSRAVDEEVLEKCEAGKAHLEDLTAAALRALAPKPTLFINSKKDIIQRIFFYLVNLSEGNFLGRLRPSRYYRRANRILENYAGLNASTFWVKGKHHVFLNIDDLFDTFADGIHSDLRDSQDDGVLDKLRDLFDDDEDDEDDDEDYGPQCAAEDDGQCAAAPAGQLDDWLRGALRGEPTCETCDGEVRNLPPWWRMSSTTRYCDKKLVAACSIDEGTQA